MCKYSTLCSATFLTICCFWKLLVVFKHLKWQKIKPASENLFKFWFLFNYKITCKIYVMYTVEYSSSCFCNAVLYF